MLDSPASRGRQPRRRSVSQATVEVVCDRNDFLLHAEILCTLALCAYLGLAALIFCTLSDGQWSLLDGFYFSLVTLTTVGYGDLVPNNTIEARSVAFVFIWINVLVVSSVQGILAARVEKRVVRLGRHLFGCGVPSQLEQGFIHVASITFLVLSLAYGFCLWEEHSFLDGIYFASVTLTTVGYGEIRATTPETRLLLCPLLLFGVVAVARMTSFLLGCASWYLQGLKRLEAASRAGVSILILLLTALFFGLGFRSVGHEHWCLHEVIYFTVVSMTTVGYGDYAPVHSDPEKMLAIAFMWMSLIVLPIIFGYISAEVELMSHQLEDTAHSGGKSWPKLHRSRFVRRVAMLLKGHAPSGATMMLVGLHLVSSAAFAIIERWSLLDALYFTSVTVTTVGYGDLVPTSKLGKVAATGLALLGVPATASLASEISEKVSNSVSVYTEKLQ